MLSKTRIAMALAAAIAVLAATGGGAAATTTYHSPQAVTGPTIEGGADGQPHELLCPPDESVYSGGFTVTPGEGRMLDRQPTDVLENHPNEDATGWIVAVRKDDCPPTKGADGEHHHQHPANLTLHLVCTDGQNNTSLGG